MMSLTMKLFVAVVSLLAVVAAQDKTATMEDVYVKLGEDATFTCDYTLPVAGDLEIVWSFAKKDDEANQVAMFKYKSSGNSITYNNTTLQSRGLSAPTPNQLTIVGATIADNLDHSKIFCKAESGANSVSASARLIVVTLPEKVEAALESPSFKAKNDQAVGKCTSSPSYPTSKIEFFKGGVMVKETLEDSFFGFTKSGTETLEEDGLQASFQRTMILNLTIADDGVMVECEVESGLGPFVQKKRHPIGVIRINHRVSEVNITATPDKEVYNEGDMVKFVCTFNGFPNAAIRSFSLDGASEINTKAEYEVKLTSANNGQVIMCEASNAINKNNTITNRALVVNYNKNTVITGSASAKLGDGVVFSCDTMASPAATFTWKKDGAVIGEGADLPIKSVSFMSAGTYTCEASNSAGVSEATHTLEVTGLSLKSSVFSDVATAGKEEMGVEMVCTAQSSSKPTFAWERAGAEAGSANVNVSAGEFVKITESEEADVYTSTLAITKLDVSFSKAMFKCSVSSGSTSHTSSFALAEIQKKSSSTGIVVGILILILVIAIIVAVLFNKGYICKKDGKDGEVDADDIEVEITKNDDIESGPVEDDKLLENDA